MSSWGEIFLEQAFGITNGKKKKKKYHHPKPNKYGAKEGDTVIFDERGRLYMVIDKRGKITR
ncbi:hypothetical protein [Syntrophus aciditrophicus]|uniref:Hypothetical cytosolic protein n=1 Tax=Syntrophus aciditrophicus (strain SB) TaxID=56780 RepID=Q2LSJ1_SYNAS|nr:hypothetical protein [Syntrophus aciditrophicus]ABC77048.1 hypothetical cytosolic protein [Syntrophus aciditrophicus SB]